MNFLTHKSGAIYKQIDITILCTFKVQTTFVWSNNKTFFCKKYKKDYLDGTLKWSVYMYVHTYTHVRIHIYTHAHIVFFLSLILKIKKLYDLLKIIKIYINVKKVYLKINSKKSRVNETRFL